MAGQDYCEKRETGRVLGLCPKLGATRLAAKNPVTLLQLALPAAIALENESQGADRGDLGQGEMLVVGGEPCLAEQTWMLRRHPKRLGHVFHEKPEQGVPIVLRRRRMSKVPYLIARLPRS